MIIELFADGFEEIEAVSPADVLRRAGLTVKTVSTTGGYTAIGAHGIPFVCDMLITDLDSISIGEISCVILPGGMPGAKNLFENGKVTALIKEINALGGIVAAICAAPFILGRLGLLSGKKATCYPGFESELTGAEICQDKAVKDGNIITAKGPGAALDFARLISEALCGEEKTNEIFSSMIAN